MKDHHSNNTAEELKKNLQAHPRATRVTFCALVLLVLALFLLCTVSLVLVFFSVDVIEVYAPQGRATLQPKIHHLEDAFQ